jgi:hypothetical protein
MNVCMTLNSARFVQNKSRKNGSIDKLKKLLPICSNPLMTNTKECIVFWSTVSQLQIDLDTMYFEINRAHDRIKSTDVTEKNIQHFDLIQNEIDDNFINEENRIYDL